MPVDKSAFKKKLKERAEVNRRAFESEHKEMLVGLLGMSQEEIERVSLDAGIETYAQLISVVKEATAANVSQAELRERIEELGGLAVSIAKRVSKLAQIFV
jgi:hypothetical protein